MDLPRLLPVLMTILFCAAGAAQAATRVFDDLSVRTEVTVDHKGEVILLTIRATEKATGKVAETTVDFLKQPHTLLNTTFQLTFEPTQQLATEAAAVLWRFEAAALTEPRFKPYVIHLLYNLLVNNREWRRLPPFEKLVGETIQRILAEGPVDLISVGLTQGKVQSDLAALAAGKRCEKDLLRN